MATCTLDETAVSTDAAANFAPGDLVSVCDFTPQEISRVIDLAADMKRNPGNYSHSLAGRQIVLFFEKPSLRTRITFEAGISSLGGVSFFVDQTASRLGAREPLSDMAHNLERWVHGIVLRTFSHETVTEMAKHAAIPVINALSDLEHPCQALADLLTLREKFGKDLSKIKVTYLGDGNNVAHSLMLVVAAVGGNITVGTPKGYEPQAIFVEHAKKLALQSGGSVDVSNDPVAAIRGANAVYTDVWASMGQEAEAQARDTIFAPFQVNAGLFANTAPDAIFMHCLPAHRGSEVTADVIDSPASVVFDQAENRLHAQKAVMLLLMSGAKG